MNDYINTSQLRDNTLDEFAKLADFDLIAGDDVDLLVDQDEPVRLEFYARETGTTEVVHASTIEAAVRIAIEYIAEDEAKQDAEALASTANERDEMIRDLNVAYGLNIDEVNRLTEPESAPSRSVIELDLAWQRGYEAGYLDHDMPQTANAATAFDDGDETDLPAFLVIPVRLRED